jgi:iron(III) transport system ATP-binding protein
MSVASDDKARAVEPYLNIEGVTKMFGDFAALSDVTLEITPGEFVCFLGPSGCGKTTLLRIIAGLERQTAGRIVQAGRDVSTLPAAARDFGIVFQSYALFPNLTVRANIAYGLENRGLKNAQIKARVDELLATVGLADQATKYPAQLSGGQQQRVALARALAPSPGLLLLDEPLSALDAKVRGRLRREIKHLQRELGVTTIMVTHDQEEALTMADRIVVMNEGRIEQIGSPEDIYREPATAFVADFIGKMNLVPAVVTAQGEVRIGEHRLGCPTGECRIDENVTLAIRPEDLTVEGAEGGNIVAVVGDIEFLGSFQRLEVSGGDLGTTTLSVDLAVQGDRLSGPMPGHTIRLSLPPDRVRVFAGS